MNTNHPLVELTPEVSDALKIITDSACRQIVGMRAILELDESSFEGNRPPPELIHSVKEQRDLLLTSVRTLTESVLSALYEVKVSEGVGKKQAEDLLESIRKGS